MRYTKEWTNERHLKSDGRGHRMEPITMDEWPDDVNVNAADQECDADQESWDWADSELYDPDEVAATLAKFNREKTNNLPL